MTMYCKVLVDDAGSNKCFFFNSSGGRGRGGSWLTACFFPSSSGRERGEALGAEECMRVYVVTADYQHQENTEISLKAGERVEVIEKSESGWWFVRTAEEQGWVPATYLVSLTGRQDSHKTPNGESKTKIHSEQCTLCSLFPLLSVAERYITVQSFSSSSQDELGFESGVIVEVIQRNLEGWWFIRYGSKEGWAPAAYLRKMQDGVMAGNQTTETNKPDVQGQVEIIGNLMEISNLLNKKPSNERHSHTQTDTTAHRNNTSVSVSVSDACVNASVSEASVSSTSSAIKTKTVTPSPAIARVAPQRFHSAETSEFLSFSLMFTFSYSSLHIQGFQLPQPPDPPNVEAEYYTIAEFRSCLTDGISFSGGQKAEVIEKNSGGWWYVQIREKEGWAPCSYIDKRKKPTLNRQTSTLTRPKVPPPAPPIKKQNSLPCVESEVMTPTSPRVYEEPEYDVPTVGLEFDPEQEFFPEDAPTKAPPPLCQSTISFMLGEGDEEDDEGVYAIVTMIHTHLLQGTGHLCGIHRNMTPQQSSPTLRPLRRKQSKLKQQADESKSKPSVRPKPANQDCSSLRRPQNQEQPGQMQFRTSRTSDDSENGSSNKLQMFSDLPSFLYRTTMAYQREELCELSFPAGVQVEVLEKQESGWWFVRWGNEEGWAPTYYLQPIKSFETNVGKMGKCVSLEKNEQRVNQSLKSGHRPNQQNCRVGVKQLTVRPQNVLKDNTNMHTTPAGRRNDALPSLSYNDQTTSCAGNTESMRRKVPVSMVKPKPHLIHNNLREEYVSIADYHGDAETMSFPAGTRLEVLERNPNGWWYCRVLDTAKTRKGWVPSNFLERSS
uniref:SH3 and PX domain-containing protein 2A-like n=1 Tax=Sinocyclocheilus anshuiensis TaxID=1608454 RepID=A0A671N6N6_9TELE